MKRLLQETSTVSLKKLISKDHTAADHTAAENTMLITTMFGKLKMNWCNREHDETYPHIEKMQCKPFWNFTKNSTGKFSKRIILFTHVKLKVIWSTTEESL